MGLTIANWGNVQAKPMQSQDKVTSSDWNELGKGLGGLARHGAMKKAADMMEGRNQAKARIAEIDQEIAQLEQQLAGVQANQQAQEAAARRGAFAAEGMAGFRPNQALAVGPAPENVTSIGGEQYLATPQMNRSFNQDFVRAMEQEQADYDRQKAMQNAMYANSMSKYRWGR